MLNRVTGAIWLSVLSSLGFLFAVPAFAQEDNVAQSIDAQINAAVAPISNAFANLIFYSVPVGDVAFPLIVGWLILAAFIFTFYFGFLQINEFF